jgi:hypothetical protein
MLIEELEVGDLVAVSTDDPYLSPQFEHGHYIITNITKLREQGRGGYKYRIYFDRRCWRGVSSSIFLPDPTFRIVKI